MPGSPLIPPTVGRRAAVLGLAATVLVAGCDTGDDLGESAGSGSPSPSTSPSAAEGPEQTPDEALVDDVLARLDAAVAVLQSARGFKGLRPAITPLLRAHRAHAEVLEGELDRGPGAARPADAAAAVVAIRTSETQLQAALVDSSGRAESGALAKLLASMSASTTQHLAQLPPEVAT